MRFGASPATACAMAGPRIKTARIVFTRPIRPIHLLDRAARPCSPIAAPSAERSRAPGRHGEEPCLRPVQKRDGTMARTSKMARAGTWLRWWRKQRRTRTFESVGETEAVAAVETGAKPCQSRQTARRFSSRSTS